MKIKSKKKILSAIAVLAVTATATAGAIGYSMSRRTSGNDVDIPHYSSARAITTALGVAPQKEGGRTFYVSPTGTATADASSRENPTGIDVLDSSSDETTYLKAGDKIVFLDGVYKVDHSLAMRGNGTYDNFITFTAENPGKVVIDFSAQNFASTARGIHVYGSYTYWYGIDVCGAGDNGMYISGSYNTVENCEFYNNRDSGLQLGRAYSEQTDIKDWPSYNLILNCTSHNNYDNETYGENADGFAAKLTIGYGNVFDGCIAYRNSDDGWDLYAKSDSGNIGAVIIYNSVAFENGYLEYSQEENNARFPTFNIKTKENGNEKSYETRDGDGNGFKLGGSVMEGDVIMENCLSFNNRMHGVTDNSNPGFLLVQGVTSYDNGAAIGAWDATKDAASQANTYGNVVKAEKRDSEKVYGNIDVSRQTYSYNSVERSVSAKSAVAANSLDNDAVRGSVQNSILGTGTTNKSYAIVGAKDVDTKLNGVDKSGTERNSITNSDFAEVPITLDGTTYTYNLTGKGDLGTYDQDGVLTKNAQRVHVKYRNTDGTINMGNMLKLNDRKFSDTFTVDIGANLSEANYAAYPHYNATVTADSEKAYVLARAKEALEVTTNEGMVYQDFEVPVKLMGTTVEWTVPAESADYLALSEVQAPSASQSQYRTVIVTRPEDADHEVKLTATITYGEGENNSVTKDFMLTLKKAEHSIGDIIVDMGDAIQTLSAEGNIIVDQYSKFSEPDVIVYDGMDYNGKTMAKSAYTVTTKYEYQADPSSPVVEIKGFSPSNAGIYTITKTVQLKTDSDGSKTKSMSYRIYVAGVASDIQFLDSNGAVGAAAVSVFRDGYIISGDVSNPSGTIYAVSSATKLEGDAALTKDNIKSYNGVQSVTFKDTSITIPFENANSESYYVYYALANMKGEIKTEVREVAVNVVTVSTIEELAKVASGTALGSENVKNTIYTLAGDIDGTDYTWTASGTFSGVLNGMGHTIKNITIDGSSGLQGMFKTVSNGTIMNVKFDNIVMTGMKTNKTGIVGMAEGGYFHNIAITNVKIEATAAERVGALCGQIQEYVTPTYIDQISVINTKDDYTIIAKQRAGGVVGFVQPTSQPVVSGYVYISDCYTNLLITVGQQAGGILGTFDNQKDVPLYVEISNCVFEGVLKANCEVSATASRVGGMVGYHSDKRGILTITDCVSIGTLWYSNEIVVNAQKNSSGIMGGYSSEGELVTGCIALMEEHNTNLYVVAYDSKELAMTKTAIGSKLSADKWNITYDSSNNITNLSLKFLEV